MTDLLNTFLKYDGCELFALFKSTRADGLNISRYGQGCETTVTECLASNTCYTFGNIDRSKRSALVECPRFNNFYAVRNRDGFQVRVVGKSPVADVGNSGWKFDRSERTAFESAESDIRNITLYRYTKKILTARECVSRYNGYTFRDGYCGKVRICESCSFYLCYGRRNRK